MGVTIKVPPSAAQLNPLDTRLGIFKLAFIKKQLGNSFAKALPRANRINPKIPVEANGGARARFCIDYRLSIIVLMEIFFVLLSHYVGSSFVFRSWTRHV